MLSKSPLLYCLIALFALDTISPTHAFGSDLLEQLTDLLFGSDESSEESTETVITTKPNATLTVICKTGCDLNVMCVNCTNVNAVMMPPAGGNGSGTGTGNGNGNGGGSSNGNGAGNGMEVTQAPMTSPSGASNGGDVSAATPPTSVRTF